MKTIFITMSRGSLIRNFLDTGVVQRLLDEGSQVVLLSSNFDDEELFAPYRHPRLIIEPLHTGTYRWPRLMYELGRLVVFNQTVDIRFRYRLGGTVDPVKALYIPRRICAFLFKIFPYSKRCLRWLDSKLNPQTQHDYLFEKYHPSIVFSTAPQSRDDAAVIKSAKRFKVATVAMPKSWDNLSKVLIFTKTDRLIVWSHFMLEQAVRFQEYHADEISVVGVPQFDYYTKAENRMSREDFCASIGLDFRKPYIFYGSSGGSVYPEDEFIDLILSYIESGILPDMQIFIRPHIGWPEDEQKFLRFKDEPRVIVDLSEKRNENFKDNWTTSKTHLRHLYNSIAHASVSINILSTLTLDAAACGIPTINLKFDPKEKEKKDTILRLHVSDYIDELEQYDGTWIAESEEDFRQALIETIVEGAQEQPNTKKMIQHFIYKVDGQSVERTAKAILNAG